MENATQNTVVLTTKDADFIAGICRDEIGIYNRMLKRKVEDCKDKLKKAHALHELFGDEDNEKEMEFIRYIDKICEEAIESATKENDEILIKYTKAIELLTSGSSLEDTEEKTA